MYFSRITLQEDAKNSLDFWQIFRNPYTLHQSIWRLFGDQAGRRRDFLYRLDYIGKRPVIYTVSARLPEANGEIWHVETKPYDPKITTGMRLAFMLRANPIRTKRDENDRQHRHDVVMEAKTRLKEQGGNKPLPVLVQEAGGAWFLSRSGKYGFAFDPTHVRAEGYQQHRFFKGAGSRQISFSTVEFNGILTVIDPELFIDALYKGIGPTKGFGCGLMMVKRV